MCVCVCVCVCIQYTCASAFVYSSYAHVHALHVCLMCMCRGHVSGVGITVFWIQYILHNIMHVHTSICAYEEICEIDYKYNRMSHCY